MNYLYHYCAMWNEETGYGFNGGVVKLPEQVNITNYPQIVALVEERLQRKPIIITSLSLLSVEEN